jgi:hypothetical protein
MDYDALVNEILSRVVAKLQQAEPAGATTCCAGAPEKPQCAPNPEPVAACKEKVLKKRVITEREVRAAAVEGATRINACENTIITDLARELAAKSCIEIVRG